MAALRRVFPVLAFASGCAGPQSALDPAGRDAERIAEIFWVMAIGAGAIWLAFVALAVYAARARPEARPRAARALVVGGGAVLPAVVLAALLTYGLAMLPPVLDLGPESGLRVTVTGEQWWWRVRYDLPDGRSFELANEVRLPVGKRVPIRLEAADVIHSFWVPALSGKMDMIPGRTTWIALEPLGPGVFRGACAEYCGASHAHMALYAVVSSQEELDAWTAREASPVGAATLDQPGAAVFQSSGCGACHTVRGTPADGRYGPDLTHVGGRVSLGAGVLANDPVAFGRWLSETDRIKPEVHMPAFRALGDEDVAALAEWLDGLR